MLCVFFAWNENSNFLYLRAILAQLVEHLIRNQAVGGSNPLDGSIILWVLVVIYLFLFSKNSTD